MGSQTQASGSSFGPGSRTAYSTLSNESAFTRTFFSNCSGVRICSRIAPS